MKKDITSVTKKGVAVLALSLTACRGSVPFIPEAKKTGTNSTYAYLLDTTDLKKPEIDLENTDGALKSVLDKGVLTVAVSADMPPYEWVDEEGNVQGAEMMLAKYIADCLEVDLAVTQTDFSGTFTAVTEGTADCAFSGYGWTQTREDTYEITIAYSGEESDAKMYCTVIVAGEDADKYTAPEDLSGARVAVLAGSIQEAFCADPAVFSPAEGVQLVRTATLDEAIQGLQYDACDAVVLDGTTAENYASKSDGKLALTGIGLDISAFEDRAGTIGICRKGERSLLEAINACIQTAKDNGYYSTWYKKEKVSAVWKTDFPDPQEETEGTESTEETGSSEEKEG